MEIPFSCNKCAFSCGTENAWKRHQYLMHGGSDIGIEDDELCNEFRKLQDNDNETSRADSHHNIRLPIQEIIDTPDRLHKESTLQIQDIEKMAEVELPVLVGPVAANSSNMHVESPGWIACGDSKLASRISNHVCNENDNLAKSRLGIVNNLNPKTPISNEILPIARSPLSRNISNFM